MHWMYLRVPFVLHCCFTFDCCLLQVELEMQQTLDKQKFRAELLMPQSADWTEIEFFQEFAMELNACAKPDTYVSLLLPSTRKEAYKLSEKKKAMLAAGEVFDDAGMWKVCTACCIRVLHCTSLCTRVFMPNMNNVAVIPH
jgi:hypothetical protein